MIRITTLFFVCIIVVLAFYLSLLVSADRLTTSQWSTVREARDVVREKGFGAEAAVLDHFTFFRANDNWLNSTIPKENAYAATNFPFGIMTIYPDFFTYPADATERAAILLHEARHVMGDDEKEAYGFVWRNREKLGWTRERYSDSPVWGSIRQQTSEYAPEIFVCLDNHFDDCTEPVTPEQP